MTTIRCPSLFTFLILVTVQCGCNRQDASLPQWQPDGAFIGELGDAAEINGYFVRPPKGYQETTPAGGPPGTKLVAWSGTPRSDGTAPMFQVMVGAPPAGERLPGLDELLTKMLDGVKRRRQNWSQSAPERGTINGLTFLRTRWSGTEPNQGWKMHGVMYVAIDGGSFIQLHTQDVEPHHEQALKRSEAAANTFKKK
jgi:hypothetical protein